MPKKEKIQQMFDGIASDYDRLNHLMSLGIDKIWRKKAIKEVVDKNREQKILDIACGTGDFSIALAEKMGSESHVYGLDLSEGMLAVMREKVAAKELETKISCQQGDSEQMNFEDSSFDRVSISFGIRNFENREVALKEILRVLVRGGKLIILELSIPENKIIRALYNFYFTRITPKIGGKISGNKGAYNYLPASVLQFPNKKEWMATMENCGYVNVKHRSFSFGICRLYVGEKG